MTDAHLALAALAAFSSSPHAVNATEVEFKVYLPGVYGYVYFTAPNGNSRKRCYVQYHTRRGLSSYVNDQLPTTTLAMLEQDQPQWDELHGYPVEQEHYL